MKRMDSPLRKTLFILLFLISFYWFFWSVRFIFSDLLPLINSTLFLSVIVIFIVSGITFHKPLKHLSIKLLKFIYKYRYWAIGLLFLGQVMISLFAQALPNADASMLHKVATTPPNGEKLTRYFSVFPNNFLLLVIFKLLNGLVTAKYLLLTVAILNALLIDWGILLLTGVAKHLRGEKFAQIVFLEGFFLFGLQPHFLSFYSDPSTFFLISLLCYLVIKNLEKPGMLLWFGIGLIFSIAYKIRMPLFIYLIALVILIIYKMFLPSERKNMKRTLLRSLLVLLGTLTMTTGINYYAKHQNFVEYDTKYSMTPWFFIDLGLTSTGAEHAAVFQNVNIFDAHGQYKTKAELTPELKEDAKKRLSQYGSLGLLKHQSTKFKIFTQEGNLGWKAEKVLKEENVIQTSLTNSQIGKKIREFLYVGQASYGNYALCIQIIWCIVVFGLVTYFKTFKRTSTVELFLQIVLFGAILYLSIFEAGRSRYLIQFLPVIILLSSIGYLDINTARTKEGSSIQKVFNRKG